MFKFPVEIRCEECEVPFSHWAYAPRIPAVGEFLVVGGYEYTVVAVKLRLLTDEENANPSSQRINTAVCLVRPTGEDEGF